MGDKQAYKFDFKNRGDGSPQGSRAPLLNAWPTSGPIL